MRLERIAFPHNVQSIEYEGCNSVIRLQNSENKCNTIVKNTIHTIVFRVSIDKSESKMVTKSSTIDVWLRAILIIKAFRDQQARCQDRRLGGGGGVYFLGGPNWGGW